MRRMYFDYASTTPTDPQVVEAMEPYFFEHFGNPASSHYFGREAQKAVENSRETLAKFLGAKTEEIIFTSGATESNNQVILGIAQQLKAKGNHIIVSKIEHPSVLEPVEYLARQGFSITYLDVDPSGFIDPQAVPKAITDQTILMCCIYANNEIGTIQPVAEIGRIAREKNIHFHVDAVQAVGHIPVHIKESNIDTISLSAHKDLWAQVLGRCIFEKGVKIPPFLIGGGQERGLRSSTQNTAGAVGLAKAIEICQLKIADEITTQTELRNQLISEILKRVDGTRLNGHPEQRLPNNSHFS